MKNIDNSTNEQIKVCIPNSGRLGDDRDLWVSIAKLHEYKIALTWLEDPDFAPQEMNKSEFDELYIQISQISQIDENIWDVEMGFYPSDSTYIIDLFCYYKCADYLCCGDWDCLEELIDKRRDYAKNKSQRFQDIAERQIRDAIEMRKTLFGL